MSAKSLIVSALRGFSSAVPFGVAQLFCGWKLHLPFWHIVTDQPAPHVKNLYPIRDISSFRADLDFLLKHFEPVSIAAILESVEQQRPFKKPVFHATFDDGLRECYDVIAPILLEKGVPASFYVNSAFVDNKALMYRYKASLLCEQAAELGVAKTEILAVNYLNQSLLDEWATQIGLDFNAFLEKEQPYLTTEQLKSLSEKGFCIGSHSIDHPQYNLVSFEEQLRQTIDSQVFVSEFVPQEVRQFAFPFTDDGVAAAFFDQIFEKEKLQLTFGGAGLKKEKIQRHLQRFPMEKNEDSASKILKTAYLYYFVKGLFGKNTIYRT